MYPRMRVLAPRSARSHLNNKSIPFRRRELLRADVETSNLFAAGSSREIPRCCSAIMPQSLSRNLHGKKVLLQNRPSNRHNRSASSRFSSVIRCLERTFQLLRQYVCFIGFVAVEAISSNYGSRCWPILPVQPRFFPRRHSES